MADEAAVTIIMRARDEASQQIQAVNREVKRTEGSLTSLSTSMRRVSWTVGIVGGAMLALAFKAAQAADTSGELTRATERLKEESAELFKILGEGALPVLKAMIEMLTKVLDLLNKLPDPVVEWGGAFLVTIGAVLVGLKLLTSTIGGVAGLLAALKGPTAAKVLGAAGRALGPVIRTGVGAGVMRAAAAVPAAAAAVPIMAAVAAPVAAIVATALAAYGIGTIINKLAVEPALRGMGFLSAEERMAQIAQVSPRTIQIVNNGVMMGNEADAQRLIEEVHRGIRARERRGQ